MAMFFINTYDPAMNLDTYYYIEGKDAASAIKKIRNECQLVECREMPEADVKAVIKNAIPFDGTVPWATKERSSVG